MPTTHETTPVQTTRSNERRRDMYFRTEHTYRRYVVIRRHLANNEGICPKDADFYKEYCSRNSIDLKDAPIPIDPEAAPLFATIEQGPLNRYSDIMERLHAGEGISQADYGFLWKHCKKNGLPFPWLKATYTLKG